MRASLSKVLVAVCLAVFLGCFAASGQDAKPQKKGHPFGGGSYVPVVVTPPNTGLLRHARLRGVRRALNVVTITWFGKGDPRNVFRFHYRHKIPADTPNHAATSIYIGNLNPVGASRHTPDHEHMPEDVPLEYKGKNEGVWFDVEVVDAPDNGAEDAVVYVMVDDEEGNVLSGYAPVIVHIVDGTRHGALTKRKRHKEREDED